MSDDLSVIYVVDDDDSVRASLKSLLEGVGWRVTEFASALEFLRYPRTAVPGCLILDMSLPDLSGLELQRRLARDRNAVPIIFITGYGALIAGQTALQLQAVQVRQT